jgi:HSP20 family protein
MAEKSTDIATRGRQPVAHHEGWEANPFRMLERFASEMDSIFDDFGLGRSWFGPWRSGRSLAARGQSGMGMWAPEIEVSQHDNELVVRADLPGMKKDDVSVDVTDSDITISGERRQEQQSERGGVYRSERSYGRFYRSIPLPDGVMADQAKATFKDGVLEIRMPALESSARGRRLEITEGSEPKK